MKMNDQCLPCLMNQIVKVASICQVDHKQDLYQKVFHYLSTTDLNCTNPEIIGGTFRLLKEHIANDDPYHDVRYQYNTLLLKHLDEFEKRINKASDPFMEVLKYAALGNIIDFHPMNNQYKNDVMQWFDKVDEMCFRIDDSLELKKDILNAQTILYIGDNCGEICIDKLFLKKIKIMNPSVHIFFAVRGFPVVNDSIVEDAYFVGIDQYATIISNGDDSLGTVLLRTSQEFQDVYYQADVIICKGSANFESLSEEDGNLYFIMMVKCAVMSQYVGVQEGTMICMKK